MMNIIQIVFPIIVAINGGILVITAILDMKKENTKEEQEKKEWEQEYHQIQESWSELI